MCARVRVPGSGLTRLKADSRKVIASRQSLRAHVFVVLCARLINMYPCPQARARSAACVQSMSERARV